MFYNHLKYINMLNTQCDYYVYSDEYNKGLINLMNQFDTNLMSINLIDNSYLLNKLVSACTKKGNSKMAFLQVTSALKLIKQFFMLKPFFLLKRAVLQAQTYIFLHRIPRGKKVRYYPRILPLKTRVHNALYIIAKTAFENSSSFRFFYISLAHAIIENSMPNNKYTELTREATAIASKNKRSMKNIKVKGSKIFTKIKRRERFKLFKKVRIDKE